MSDTSAVFVTDTEVAAMDRQSIEEAYARMRAEGYGGTYHRWVHQMHRVFVVEVSDSMLALSSEINRTERKH